MKAAYLLLLVLIPLPSLFACPLPWEVRFLDPDGVHRTPEIGEGAPQAARSSAGAGRGLSRPAPGKASRPKQSPTSQRHPAVGNATKFHQRGSDKSVGAVKGGFIGTATVSGGRTPSVTRPAAPSINNVRHRAANPAVVSGSAISHSSNTAAINGTRMSRKP